MTGLQEAAPGAAGRFNYSALHAEVTKLLGKQLFFIGGMPRSGTTWLQLLLDSHPQVSCSTERHFVNHLFPAVKKALEDHNAFLLEKEQTVFRELQQKYPIFDFEELEYVFASAVSILLLKQTRGRDVLAIGEKTPENLQVFGGFKRMFPAAKYIHIVRDPRDAAVSAWFHVLRVIPEQTKSHFKTMPDYLRFYGEIWAEQVTLSVEFGARHPDRYTDLRYTDLVESPEATLARLFHFLGVDHDGAVVRRCLEETSFEKLSGGRGRGEEDRNSLFRKGVLGDWQKHFDPATHDYLLQKCGELMRRFGFL